MENPEAVIENLCQTIEWLTEDCSVIEFGNRKSKALRIVWEARGKPDGSTGRPPIQIKPEYDSYSKDSYERATGYGVKW